MTSASDKARFFLEQSVPELKEWERKNIFSKEEITSITQKRSNFEHKVNARGPSPSDYTRYAEFEINVDTLRRRRVKKLGIKTLNHTGQRRIFMIFDRATKKFPGDFEIWMQYLGYTRRQRALKKVSQILTAALRLHPQRSELWIYAAQFSLEEDANMTEARSYMQRGLRFCKSSPNIWLEYTRLELLYVAKIETRRQILGIDQPQSETPEGTKTDAGLDADMISLPRLSQNDINPSSDSIAEVDTTILEKFEHSPVLSGAIPMAIFDAAMKQFDHDENVAKSVFDAVADFTDLGCQSKFLIHVVDDMLEHRNETWQSIVCHIKAAVTGLRSDDPRYPKALGVAVHRLRGYSSRLQSCPKAREELEVWLDRLYAADNIDPALQRVAQAAKALLTSPATVSLS